MHLSKAITLPCDVVLKNRFAKSATSEMLDTTHHDPSKFLASAYERWAKGGRSS